MARKTGDTKKTTTKKETAASSKKSKDAAKEKAKETVKKTAKTIDEKAEQAKSASEKLRENLKDADQKTKKEAKKQVDSAKEKFKDISDQTTDKAFWDDVQENVSAGARTLNEEAKDFAEKVSSYSENIFGAIREKAKGAFKQGSDLTAEGVNYAQKVADQYRDRYEINKLNEDKKKAASQLGMHIYLAYKNNDNRVPVQTFAQKKVKSVIKELEDIDKEIIKLSQEQ